VISFVHKSVMMAEVLEALAPRAGGAYLDGTLGGGGHSEAILEASSPTGRLFACDRDASAVAAATARLARFSGRFELRQKSFAEVDEWVPAASCDGAVVDLGCSSPQLDDPARGFALASTADLDMRFDQRQGLAAAEVVNGASEEELATIFWELGDERYSRRLARAIVAARATKPFTTPKQLADFVAGIVPVGGGRIHPATRAFQALRCYVNDEMGALDRGLPAIWRTLKPHARFVAISFHSGEDRRVKAFGRELARDYEFDGDVDVPELRRPRPAKLRWISRKALTPSPEEIAANPRARSARLRIVEKLSD
jgi:16S rRNA (cytosine1402-N4)-methyltransferase